MYDRDNERKLNPEWWNDGKGVTLYAPAILMQGIKKINEQNRKIKVGKDKQTWNRLTMVRESIVCIRSKTNARKGFLLSFLRRENGLAPPPLWRENFLFIYIVHKKFYAPPPHTHTQKRRENTEHAIYQHDGLRMDTVYRFFFFENFLGGDQRNPPLAKGNSFT